MRRISTLAAAMFLVTALASSALCQDGGYMLIHQAGARGFLYNLGPTGIWAEGPHDDQKSDHNKGCFIVQRAEVGSPAHGLIKPHDVITGANGKAFPKDQDPRYAMAWAIEDSEAKDGKLVLDVTRGGASIKVTVLLEKLPAHSSSWPFDCERTDMVLQKACEYLKREQMPEGDVVADDGHIGPAVAGLLWLAMGEPRYMQNACRAAYWYKDRIEAGKAEWCWSTGYGGMLLAEYYFMTGDPNILPGIESTAKRLADTQMPNGSWSHWGFNGYNAGYGAVNLAGMACYKALLLARECGVKVDHEAIARADRYFEAFAPTLNNKYGNNPMDYTKMDYTGANGKAGGIAVAHRLNNKPVHSTNFALKAARSMDRLEKGHTGHFFNVMWTGIAASQAPAEDYRSCMDQMGWYLTLSRHWRGGLFCPPARGGSKYSSEGGVNMTTGGYGLALAVPRRHLRILGAPQSVFTQELPAGLEAARKLHQSTRWDEAVAAVDTFLKKGGHDKESVRLANELRDKSRYMKAGVEEAYTKLEELASGSGRKPKMGSRVAKVTGIIRHLRMLLGEDDARLKEIEASLPEKYRHIWKHGQDYHDAFRTMRTLDTYKWFIYASLLKQTVPELAMPADSPAWYPIVGVFPKKEALKVMALPLGQDEPNGWAGLDFDDRDWKEKLGNPADAGGRRRKNPSGPTRRVLVRVPFEMQAPNVNQLRVNVLGGMPGLSAGARVYLNGECVLEARSGLAGKKTDVRVDLLKNARYLLRRGKNVLAYSTHDDVAYVVLEGDGIFSKKLDWTVDPDRDAEIRKLVAKRRKLEPYYDFAKDKRTAEECMAAFTAEPFFMPEAWNALVRFRVVLKDVPKREPYVKELLKSSNWGARWTGLNIMTWGMGALEGTFETGAYIRKIPDELRHLVAKSPTCKEDSCAMAEKFLPQIIGLLDDPHPTVQKEACTLVGLLGPKAKGAIPGLLKILKDTGLDGQPFRNRNEAYAAIVRIQPGDTVLQEATRIGLTDPAFAVRNTVLQATVTSGDEAISKAAVQTYKEEFIDQLFTMPVSKGGKKALAGALLKKVSKDDLRPHLDRIFGSLSHRLGAQLEGSINILLAFGEEVRPKLEELAQSDDLVIRYNAITTLLKMTAGDKMTPKRVEFFKANIRPLLKMDNEPKAAISAKWLAALEAGEPVPELGGK